MRKVKGWIHKPTPANSKGQYSGWLVDVSEVLVDEAQRYCILIREVDTPWGKVEHAAIRNAASTDIPWAEKQRIKNEVFGEGRTALEVFPTKENLVDAANMYHLCVLPEGFRLPFGIKNEEGKKDKVTIENLIDALAIGSSEI
jgi:hypothetical protein